MTTTTAADPPVIAPAHPAVVARSRARVSSRFPWLFIIAFLWLVLQAATQDWSLIFQSYSLDHPRADLLIIYFFATLAALVLFPVAVLLLRLLVWRPADAIFPVVLILLASVLHIAAGIPYDTVQRGALVLGPIHPFASSWLLLAYTHAAFTLILGFAAVAIAVGRAPARATARNRAAARALRARPTLNPFAILFGPIFQKEVRVAGRHRSTYVARALFGFILTAVVTLTYLGVSSNLDYVTGAARLQQFQNMAPTLASSIVGVQFAILFLLSPLLTAGAIVSERQSKSLAVLMTTPLTSLQVVAGKLTGSLVQILILALLVVPVLLAVRIFGGLSTDTVIGATAVSLSTAVLGASLGLLFSTWHTRAATAGVLAIITLFLIIATPAILASIYALRISSAPDEWFGVFCAPIALVLLTQGQAQNIPIEINPRLLWIGNSLWSLALASVVLFAATVAVRRVMLIQAAGSLQLHNDDPAPDSALPSTPAEPAADDPQSPAQTPALPVVPAAPAKPARRRAARASREVHDNPVLWRELRRPIVGSRINLVVVLAVVFAISALFYNLMDVWDAGLTQAFTFIALTVLALQAAVGTTASVAGEREASTWLVLMTTPLTVTQILTAKFLGALRKLWLAPALLAIHLTIVVTLGYAHPFLALHILLVFIAIGVALSGIGLLLSVLLKRPTWAAVANLGTIAALWLGLPILLSLIENAFSLQQNPYMQLPWRLAFVFNPYWILDRSIVANVTDSPFRNSSGISETVVGSFSQWQYTAMLASGAALATLLGVAAYLLALRAFKRVSGRVS